MRLDNLVVSLLGGGAVGLAGWFTWRWRSLPVVRPALASGATAKVAALDGLRTIVCVLSAGAIAGLLVPGLGGRLLMRLLAATSGDGAQGALTEAEERVGEITLGGTVGFVIFVGLIIPLLSSLVFVPLRHVLPRTAWLAGVSFGLLLLGTFGVGDPMSPENVDFAILSPRILAVLAIVAVGLLFGTTFAALLGRFNETVPAFGDPRGQSSAGGKAAYLSLIFLTLPPLLVASTVYVVGRAVSRGRAGTLLHRQEIRTGALAIGAVVTLVAVWQVVEAAVDIV